MVKKKKKKYLSLNQVKFKSDLNKLKRRQYKPEKQISAIQNIKDFFYLRKKLSKVLKIIL